MKTLTIAGLMVAALAVALAFNLPAKLDDPKTPAPPVQLVAAQQSSTIAAMAASDTVPFNKQHAMYKRLGQDIGIDTDVCMHRLARGLLLSGERSRTVITNKVAKGCGSVYRNAMVGAGATPAAADAYMGLFAAHALEEVLADAQ